ncbi:HEAT repeat domain-containing protein [Engelhardtia mirabilis]|uniref:HEAT repeat protein n=1 Tax=Engelhardtia mirabilis TaxID=2528011 RepID=A0A518BKT9_9BACT|nr:hypothetical protein Pla133_26510 [Planctomycetes bacterium Pla133]QDV01889.1 hypothetical protein Pla86_26500 [Planctomycetes bacterium Pla86]
MGALAHGLRPRRPALGCSLIFVLALAGCGKPEGATTTAGSIGGTQQPAGTSGTGLVGPERPVAEVLRADPWIEAIFATCGDDHYYDRDTSDLIGILVDKLEHGRGEPLKRAIEELGAMGEDSVPELRRLLDLQLNDASRAGSIQNTLGALGQNDGAGAPEQLARALDHPQRTIRTVALRGLRRTGAPPDRFDYLAGLARVGDSNERGLAALTMHATDAARAELLFLDWIERGEVLDVEESILPLIALSEVPETLAEAERIRRDVDPRARAWFAAMFAARGDESAREDLYDALSDERTVVRSTALRAAASLGLWEVVAAVLETDPESSIRASAAAALHSGLAAAADGEHPELAPTEAQRERALGALRSALNGEDPTVAAEAQIGLTILGDEEAVSRALLALDESPVVLTRVLPSLRERMERDPALAGRVYDRLRRRIEAEEQLPWSQRAASFQALSVVRTRAAAELLMAYADQAAAEGAILSGAPAHRWFCVHATNTGPQGRKYLIELLLEEPDPVRRLDLTFAIGGERDDLARTALTERMENDDLPPLERLYAASLLVGLGPAAEVAPRLKRAALRTQDDQGRIGFQCLLWLWY